MKLFRILPAVVTTALMLASGSALAQNANRASHVDFDDQLIQGQVNKGAVHLIERRDADLGSLVKVRKDYRKEILAGSGIAEPEPAPAALVAAIPMMQPASASAPAPRTEVLHASASAPASAAPAKAPARRPAARPAPRAKAHARPAVKTAMKSSVHKKGHARNGGSRAISRR